MLCGARGIDGTEISAELCGFSTRFGCTSARGVLIDSDWFLGLSGAESVRDSCLCSDSDGSCRAGGASGGMDDSTRSMTTG